MNLKALDRLYLMGDEDTDVSLHCKDCWREGLPLAFYGQFSQAYAHNPDVVHVKTIGELVNTAIEHAWNVHGISI